MTDLLRIAHLRITHQAANPELGNPDIHTYDDSPFTLLPLKICEKIYKVLKRALQPDPL